MFGPLKSFFRRSDSNALRVEAYWCESAIKLPKKIQTPSGGSVTVVSVCVDIEYLVKDGEIELQRVQLAQSGGRIVGSDLPLNVSATRRGEAWYADYICPVEFPTKSGH
jgi:hypothetical protein